MLDVRDILRKRALVLLLLVNGGIAFFAVKPLAAFLEDMRQDPSVSGWNPKAPIVALERGDLEPDGSDVRLGAVTATLSFDPAAPVAGEKATVVWTLADRRGRAVPIDRTMHDKPVHAYAIRDDLQSDMLHMHPLQQDEGPSWKDVIIFPSAGRWSLSMQAAAAGTLYVFDSIVDVGGTETATSLPDEARERAMFQYVVSLDAPEKVTEGDAAKFRFAVSREPPARGKKAVEDARQRHNLILAHAGDGTVWNHHGDGSVDMVASRAPVGVVRRFSAEDPYDYLLTFPSSGLWLVDFELLGEAAPFMVRVEPRK